MPSKETIDRIVKKALPEFEKGLRNALNDVTGKAFAFDIAVDAKGETYSLVYLIVKSSLANWPLIDNLNTPANPPGEKQNAKNTKDSPRST